MNQSRQTDICKTIVSGRYIFLPSSKIYSQLIYTPDKPTLPAIADDSYAVTNAVFFFGNVRYNKLGYRYNYNGNFDKDMSINIEI